MSYENFEKALMLIEQHQYLLDKPYPQDPGLINSDEQALGVKFPPSYRVFLEKFGILGFGSTEIYGFLGDQFAGGHADIVRNTLMLRQECNTFHQYIIICDEGNGHYCLLDTSEVNEYGECTVKVGYGLFLPDDRIKIEKRYEDFGDFLLYMVQFEIEGMTEHDKLNTTRVHQEQETNLDRIKVGKPPIGPDGELIHLHYMNEKANGSLAEVQHSFHRKNFKTLHIWNDGICANPRPEMNSDVFRAWKKAYWMERTQDFLEKHK